MVAVAEQMLKNARNAMTSAMTSALEKQNLTQIQAASQQIENATKKVEEANLQRSEQFKERKKLTEQMKNR